MKANGLRIGNLFTLNGAIVEISEITRDGYSATHISGALSYNTNSGIELKPIPLTEWWLSEFGFQLFPWGWVKDRILIRWDINTKTFWVELGNGVKIGLCHVHTLQNFIYLTGEGLTMSNNSTPPQTESNINPGDRVEY